MRYKANHFSSKGINPGNSLPSEVTKSPLKTLWKLRSYHPNRNEFRTVPWPILYWVSEWIITELTSGLIICDLILCGSCSTGNGVPDTRSSDFTCQPKGSMAFLNINQNLEYFMCVSRQNHILIHFRAHILATLWVTEWIWWYSHAITQERSPSTLLWWGCIWRIVSNSGLHSLRRTRNYLRESSCFVQPREGWKGIKGIL